MLKTKEEIKQWLDSYNIQNYTINDNLTVDVNGNVDLTGKELTEIPVQFGKVTGGFDCYRNNLTSCKGFPISVGTYLDCSYNNIISLIGCPPFATRFFCSANKLTSLEGCPKEVTEQMNCSSNNLTSLIGSPRKLSAHFACSQNQLINLDGCPDEVGDDFICKHNPIMDLSSFNCKFDGNFIHAGSFIPECEELYKKSDRSDNYQLLIKHADLIKVICKLKLIKNFSELKLTQKNDKKPKI